MSSFLLSLGFSLFVCVGEGSRVFVVCCVTLYILPLSLVYRVVLVTSPKLLFSSRSGFL